MQGKPSLKLCVQGTQPHTVTRVAKTCGSRNTYLYICAQYKDKIQTCREEETRVPACSTSHPQPLGTARSQCQQPSSSCTPRLCEGAQMQQGSEREAVAREVSDVHSPVGPVNPSLFPGEKWGREGRLWSLQKVLIVTNKALSAPRRCCLAGDKSSLFRLCVLRPILPAKM